MSTACTLVPLYDVTDHGGERSHRASIAYAVAFVIGFALTYSTYPLDFLLGTVDWLQAPEGDLAINVIAQRYFLADTWHWPLLHTFGLDAPRGVNIAYSDGIPLLALPLKVVAPLLPQGTHGVYSWYAVAWLLQPVAAVWCLRSAGEQRLLPGIVVAVAAASMPAWWSRFDHAALCSHFFLLVALGLYLRVIRRGSWRLWLAAATVQLAALLTHPYLAVMVLALLGAAPLTLLLRRDLRWLPAALGFAATLGGLLTVMSLLGYLGATGGAGFGMYSMNLLAPVWPAHSSLFPWTLQPIDATGEGAFEGYNYLGAGLLFGLGAGVLLRFKQLVAMVRRHLGLAAALLSLTALAVSQRPAIGSLVLIDLGAVPDWLENLRSTGRFFWPVAYASLVAVVLLVARTPDRRVAAALLVTIGVLQFADATKLRTGLQERVARYGASWLVDERALRIALTQHDNLTLLPSWGCVPALNPVPDERLQRQVMILASEVAVPVSTAYMARWQGTLKCDDERVASAPLGRSELRVLTPAAQASYLALVPDGGRFCSPLGRLVVCEDPGSTAAPPSRSLPKRPELAIGNTGFARGQDGVRLLDEGWSDPEPNGVWSEAASATLAIERPSELTGPLRLALEVIGFAPGGDEQQRLELWAQERRLGRWSLPDRQPTSVTALLPSGPAGSLSLELRVDSPTAPRARGVGADGRTLGVMLRQLAVTAADDWPVLAEGEIRFSTAAPSRMLGSGWYPVETGGVWSSGKHAELQLKRSPELTGPLELKFRLEALAPSDTEPQEVELLLNGGQLASWRLADRKAEWVSAVLPAGAAGPLLLNLRVASPTRPADRSLSADTRLLGVNLQTIKIRPASWWQAFRADPMGLGLR